MSVPALKKKQYTDNFRQTLYCCGTE